MFKNNSFFRTVAVLLCLSMVLGFVPGGIFGSTTVAKAETNFIFEEQFDSCSPLANWTTSSGSPKIYSNYYNGTNSLFFEGSNSPWAQSASFDVTAGTAYKLSLYAQRQGSGILAGYMMLVFLDSNGNELKSYTADIEGMKYNGSAASDWQEESMIGTAPVGSAKAYVKIRKNNANFGIDNLRVYETELPTVESITDVCDTWPRLYFNAQELAEMKAHINDDELSAYGFTWESQFSTLIANAEAYLQETQIKQGFNLAGRYVMFDIYPELVDPSNLDYYQDDYLAASTNDNGELVEKPYLGYGCLVPDSLRVRMETLSLAYVLTGDTRYSDRAIHYAVSMSGWEAFGDAYWMSKKVAYADASVAWATQGVAAVYDMCYDQLSDIDKVVIEEAIISKGLEPMSKQVDPNSIVNGNMMFVGGMLTGIAAIIRDDNISELQSYIERALYCVEKAMNNYAYSGNTEGHYYTGFGLDYFLPGVAHFYRATGLQSIVKHPLLAEMLPYWTTMFAAPKNNKHPNYSDGGVAVQLQLPIAVVNKLTGDPMANYFLTQIGGVGSAFENLIYLDPEPEVEAPSDRVAVVNPIGYGVLRTGFADGDMMLTLLANNSQMGHNHWDQNSIQFVAGGDWLVADPGVGSYYYADRTFWQKSGHSTILINGNAQSVKGTGSMAEVFDSALYGYIVGSAPGAYGAGVLSKFDRHAIQLNHKDKAYYILIDDLASSTNRTYGWQMYNGARDGFTVDGTAISEGGTLSGNNVSMTVNGKELFLTFVDGDKLSISDKLYYGIDENNKQILGGHTLIASSAAAKTHQFMTVMSVGEAVAVKQTIDNSSALAAMINYSRNLNDFVFFNRTTGFVTAGSMNTDAQQASVLGLNGTTITEGFAATNATKLTYASKVLFEAASKLSIVADSEGWHISTESAQTVKLYAGNAAATFTFNGTTVTPDANGYITVNLPAGDSVVEASTGAEEEKPALGGVDSFTNGDFESGETAWEGFNESATVEDGVLNVDVTGAASSITQAFTAKQRDLCNITLRYQYISGQSAPYIALYFYQDEVAPGNLIGASKKVLTDKTSGWQDISFNAQVPSGANIIEVRIGSEPGSTVAYQVDDVAVKLSHRALVNGGFEDGTVGWDGSSNTMIYVTDSDSFSGNNSLLISSEGTGCHIGQVFDAQAHDVWEVTIKYRWISGTGSVYAGAWFYKDQISKAQNSVTGEYLYLTGATATYLNDKSGQWVETTAYFTAPAETNIARLEIGYHSKNTAVYLIDDVSMRKVASYCYTDFNGSTPPNKETWLESEGGAEETMSSTSNRVCRWNDNKLVFQSGVNGKNYYAKSPEFEVEAGKNYTVEFLSMHYIKSGTLTGTMDIVFLDEDGNFAGAADVSAYGGTANSWTSLALDVTAPENAVTAYLQFNYATTNVSNYYYIKELGVKVEGSDVEDDSYDDGPVVVFSDAFESYYTPEGVAASVKIPTGWTASSYSSAALSCAKYVTYDGTYNLCFQDAGAKWMKSPSVKVKPGYIYTANFVEMKLTDSVGSGGYAKLIFTDANGTVLLEEQIVAGASATWTDKVIEAQAPANAAYAFVEFGIKNGSGEPSYAVDRLRISATKAELPEPTYPLNGNFENGTTEWSSSSAMSISKDDKHGGSAALKFTDTSVSNAYYITQVVPVEPGKTYVLSGWVKNLVGSGGYFGIYGIENATATTFTAASGWNQYSVTVTIPEDIDMVVVEIGSHKNVVTTFLLDDLVMEEEQHDCADNDGDHKCDKCGEVLSKCADKDKDHKCDVCGETLTACADGNKDHKCDLCGNVLTECSDVNGDDNHNCDVCGKANITACTLAGHAYKCECGKIMRDPVFEDEFDRLTTSWTGSGWKPGGTAYMVYDAERGSMVAKVEDLSTHIYDEAGNLIQRGGSSELITEKFPVAGGVTYTLSFWYKQDAAVVDIATSTNLPMSIQWFDANGVRIDPNGDGPDSGKDYYTSVNPVLSTQWQQYEVAVNVPAGAAQAWIQLSVDTAGINAFYVDDISFVKSDVLFTENFNRSIFDYGWTKSSGSNAMIYDHAVEGKSLILQSNASVWAKTPAIAVIPGYTYTASFKHSKTSYDKGATYSVGSGGRAALIFVDKSGNLLQEDVITVGEQNGWEQADLTARAPANAANMYVKYYVDASYTGDPCFSVDSLNVKEKAGEILQPVATSLLVNGDFSNGKIGWNGNLTVNEDGQAVIPAGDSGAYFASNSIIATPGEIYRVSLNAARTSGTSTAYLGFWYYDANGAVIDAAAIRMGEDAWTEYAMDWVVPEGVATFKVEFGVNSKANSAFLVDNVVLTKDENSCLAENFDGAYERTQWNDGKDRTNDLPAGWTPSKTQQITMSLISGKWGAKDGKMLFFQAPNWIKSPSFAATPGMTYTVSYDEMDYAVAGSSVKNTGGYVMLVFVDADGNAVDTKKVAIKDDTVAQVWSAASFDAVAPEGAVSAYVEIGYEKVDGDAVFGIDNLKVTKNSNIVEDDTVVAPEYPEYAEDFENVSVSFDNWTADNAVGVMKNSKFVMQLTGSAYGAAFAVIPGATYAIDMIADSGVTAAFIWLDANGAQITAQGNVAPAGAVQAQVVLTATTTAIVENVAAYMVCEDSDNDQDHACDTCGNVMGECVNADGDHDCDICDKVLTACADDNKDHKCDLCGAVVTACADDNKDHKCDICDAVLSECADDNKDGKCDICGANLGPVIDEKAKFASTGLSLGAFIGLQSAIMKSALNSKDFDEAYFIYKNAAGETVRGELMDMGSYFVADVPVNAKQMADVYEITPVYVNDGVTYYGVTKTASVMEEAMKKVNDTKTDEKTENTRKLCIAMLNYGAEAQKNFGYNTENLANAELTDAQKVLPTFADLNLTKTNNIPTTPIKPAQSGMSLGDVVYMQFLVAKKNVNATGTLVYKVGSEDAVEVAVADLETLSSYYIINIPIKAKHVRTDITITIQSAAGADYTMVCSIEAFAIAKAGTSTENLVAALMAYGDAADVLF